MVAVVIAFPRIVTGNISEAAGAIKGSGADELRRQIEGPVKAPPPAAPDHGLTTGRSKRPSAPDAGAELERLLQARK